LSLQSDELRLFRWAFFEDLHFLELKISIDYILNCKEYEFYEMVYRYAGVLAKHKDIAKERKYMYKDFLRR